jgi:hypothetical protein
MQALDIFGQVINQQLWEAVPPASSGTVEVDYGGRQR